MLTESSHDQVTEKQGRLLLVDDEPGVLQALKRLFYRQFDVVVANSGDEAIEQLNNGSFDMIISDMRMPGMNGAQLLKTCFETWPQMIRVLLTGYSDLDSAIKAVNEGNIYRYISKPWDNDQLRTMVVEALESRDLKAANVRLSAHIVDQNEELARLNRELQVKFQGATNAVGEAEAKLQEAYQTLRQEFDAMVHILVGIMEARNGEESGSTEKIALLTKTFAVTAKLDESRVDDTYYAALLRNIGKVGLADAVLTKAISQMSNAEKTKYGRFTINGQTSLMLLEPLQNAANIIRSHMELYNGKGFPDRLAGDAIPKEARILRIVGDFVELQREHNFLGETLTEEDAKTYLVRMAGQRYDRELVDVFVEVLDSFDGGVVPNMERIPITEAKVGMILAGNLVSPGGAVLLPSGTELNERHVAKLATLSRQFEGHQIMLHIRRIQK
ncbi:HD domain-containing phosphohydrolase [Thalassolituus oleivorans]|uniref:HD domain-containing phosphohydrolase n=1 Tax=Thalassolituus oleivorans TaxID=187493 RepID=UPI00240A1962|nr:HD domain-containing phosphohydrolase [Thalassolituus oleivorans]MDF1640167.1 response regulator [Thalassolituus oleivorans]